MDTYLSVKRFHLILTGASTLTRMKKGLRCSISKTHSSQTSVVTQRSDQRVVTKSTRESTVENILVRCSGPRCHCLGRALVFGLDWLTFPLKASTRFLQDTASGSHAWRPSSPQQSAFRRKYLPGVSYNRARGCQKRF
jgi:hypothetical protein